MFPIKDNIPHRESPFVTWAIILINGLIFFFELSLPRGMLERFILHFGMVPARYTNPAWALSQGLSPMNLFPFLSSIFLHGGWMHFLGNMWSLWLFGDNVEDRVGHFRFLVFYLLCGLLAGVTHFIFNPTSRMPTIGASGAIAGVMGAYFIMFPTARVITLVPVFFLPYFVEIPAVVFFFFWFLSQLYGGMFSLLLPQGVGGIAWWAHVGGFVFGIVLVPFFRKRRRAYRPYYLDEVYYKRFIL